MMIKFYFGNFPQCLKAHEQKAYGGDSHKLSSAGTASIPLTGQTTPGWVVPWATWASGWHSCPHQRGWNWVTFKVPLNPGRYHILSYLEIQIKIREILNNVPEPNSFWKTFNSQEVKDFQQPRNKNPLNKNRLQFSSYEQKFRLSEWFWVRQL